MTFWRILALLWIVCSVAVMLNDGWANGRALLYSLGAMVVLCICDAVDAVKSGDRHE